MISRRRFFRSIAAAGCGWAAGVDAKAGRATAFSSVDLKGWLEPIRKAHAVPALAAVWVRSAGVAAQGVVGTRVKGGEKRVEEGDLFHLGSCTKSMTATLIATLVEDGAVSWETTIADALPDLVGDGSPYRDVRLVDLLAHRSGLPGRKSPEAYRALESDYRRLSGSLHEQRLEMTRRALAQAPGAEPGTRFDYSNLGYIVAGAMIEKVTGQGWEPLMRERLFKPLGMTTAGFGAPGSSDHVDQPRGHAGAECSAIEPGPEADNAAVLGPAGTVHSSMTDWAKYAVLHLRGARGERGGLLDPSTLQAMQRDHQGQGYGLGWVVTERDWAGGAALTHTGSNTLWYSVIWIAPARNAAFLAATNCGSDQALEAIDTTIQRMIREGLHSCAR